MAIVIVLGIVAVAGAGFYMYQLQEAAKETAEQDYRDSLRRLEQSPADPQLKRAALESGRHYSHLSRNSQGVALFDEVALMNDISAACASAAVATQPSTLAPAVAKADQSPRTKLMELSALRSEGFVSEEEYDVLRTKILSELTA